MRTPYRHRSFHPHTIPATDLCTQRQKYPQMYTDAGGWQGRKLVSEIVRLSPALAPGERKNPVECQALQPELDNSPLSLARPRFAPSAPTPAPAPRISVHGEALAEHGPCGRGRESRQWGGRAAPLQRGSVGTHPQALALSPSPEPLPSGRSPGSAAARLSSGCSLTPAAPLPLPPLPPLPPPPPPPPGSGSPSGVTGPANRRASPCQGCGNGSPQLELGPCPERSRHQGETEKLG